MNSTIKSVGLLGAAGAALFFGLRVKQDKALEALNRAEAAALGELAESAKNLEILKAKLEVAKTESKAGSGFEEKLNQSAAVIGAERRKIADLMAKWPAVDAERVAAVKDVRAKEASRPPVDLTLTDGTKLTRFVIHGVPDEKTVSVEHAGGLGKIPAAKLPEDVRTRLGIGWQVDPPAMLDFDAKGNAVARQGDASNPPGGELDLGTLDTSNVTAVVKSLALVEAQLSKTVTALETEKAVLRKHSIFKPEVVAPGTGKTYQALKEECNLRLAGLADRVEALKKAKGTLQQKLKTS